jgi:4a-hydroxytetrahydrobiopterin dehydratase
MDHHPDIHLSWGRVKVVIWTHKVGGLVKNDFVFAASVDELPR